MPQEIEFHPGLPDVAEYLLRLLQKAQARRLRVVVTGDPDWLGRLDVQLWTADAGSFLPHARLRGTAAAPPMLARTPLWFADDPRMLPEAEVLVNIGPDMPAGWDGFQRVVELVGDALDAAAAGRQRWRHYLAAGAVPVDVRKRAAATGEG